MPMAELRFDDTDYSVGLPLRTRGGGKFIGPVSSPIGQLPTFFRRVAAANNAGKTALEQLLGKLDT